MAYVASSAPLRLTSFQKSSWEHRYLTKACAFERKFSRRTRTHNVTHQTSSPVGATCAEDFEFAIQFLGTSSARPTLTRNVSSAAILSGPDLFLVDAGEGSLSRLLSSPLCLRRQLRSIFITHLHADHVLGLPPLLASLSQTPLCPPSRHVDVYGPPGLRSLLRVSLGAAPAEPRPPVEDGVRVGVGIRVGAEAGGASMGRGLPDIRSNTAIGAASRSPQRETEDTSDLGGSFRLGGGVRVGEGDGGSTGVTFRVRELRPRFPHFYKAFEHRLVGIARPQLRSGQINHYAKTLNQQEHVVDGEVIGEDIRLMPPGVWHVADFSSQDGDVVVTVTSAPLRHYGVQSCGYVFERRSQSGAQDRRKLVVLGDTSDPSLMEPIAAAADVIVHEATFPERSQDRAVRSGHSTPSMAGRFARRVGAAHLVLTHFSPGLTPTRGSPPDPPPLSSSSSSSVGRPQRSELASEPESEPSAARPQADDRRRLCRRSRSRSRSPGCAGPRIRTREGQGGSDSALPRLSTDPHHEASSTASLSQEAGHSSPFGPNRDPSGPVDAPSVSMCSADRSGESVLPGSNGRARGRSGSGVTGAGDSSGRDTEPLDDPVGHVARPQRRSGSPRGGDMAGEGSSGGRAFMQNDQHGGGGGVHVHAGTAEEPSLSPSSLSSGSGSESESPSAMAKWESGSESELESPSATAWLRDDDVCVGAADDQIELLVTEARAAFGGDSVTAAYDFRVVNVSRPADLVRRHLA